MLEGMSEANETSIAEALIGDIEGSKAVCKQPENADEQSENTAEQSRTEQSRTDQSMNEQQHPPVVVLQCSKKWHDRALHLAALCAAQSQLSESILVPIANCIIDSANNKRIHSVRRSKQ